MSEHGEQRDQHEQQQEERQLPGEGDRQGAQQSPQRQPQQARPAAALVFDDPLDRRSADDSDTGWGESRGGSGAAGPATGGGRDLAWYLSEKPPHHGG